MNIVFGGNNKKAVYELNACINSIYHEGTEFLTGKDCPVQIGRIKNQTKISGQCEKNGVHLLLHGFLQKPLEAWKYGFPPDNPDLCAQYLLDRYFDEGLNFLDNIYGHFSVILHDSSKNRFLIASDPYNYNNIFYYNNENQILFSTNLFSLASGLREKIQIDRSLEDFFLVYGFFPWERTMYQGIKYLPAKKILQWTNGKISIHQINHSDIWKEKFQNLKNKTTSEDYIIDALHDSFFSALDAQLTSEKRVAVLLGGFDSALVASGLKKLGKEVETFSFYYDDERFNQPHTDTVSKFLGSKHHWIKINADIISQGLKNYPKIFNTPTNWPNYVIQTQYLSKVIKEKGFNYCYTGDGCDYMFFGYPITYKKINLLSKLGQWPKWLVNFLLGISQWKIADRKLGRPYHVALGILRSLKRDMPERGIFTIRAFDDFCLKQLRNGENPPQEHDIEYILKDIAHPYLGLHPLQLGYIGKRYLAPYKIKMTGSLDSTGLILNSPFLYIGLEKFARNLSEDYLRPSSKPDKPNIGKYILAKMAEKYKLLPKEVIYQNKVGAVDAPISDWYAGDMKDFILNLMNDLPFDYNKTYIRNLIRPKWAEKLWEKLISGDTNNVVTISHGISLLATYASFTSLKKYQP